MSKTLALTEELIALSSVTPDDKGCQQRLIELLREHDGFWEEQRLEPGWWNQDVGSALTERRREVYGEVY